MRQPRSKRILCVSFWLLLGFGVALIPRYALAARIFAEPSQAEVSAGELFKTDVFLDTEGEYINAVEGELSFGAPLLLLHVLRYGDSAVSLWVEEPAERTAGVIGFSGIIPGGLEGKRIFLFSAFFEGSSEGEAVFTFGTSRALRHDGRGTEIILRSVKYSVAIANRAGESAASRALRSTLSFAHDDEPPEVFTPVAGRSRGLFGGRYFVAFETKDKQSGLAYYEIQEGISEAHSAAHWRRVESPSVLSDQTLRSFIFIRAVDKVGNERIASLVPAPVDRQYLARILWSILTVLLTLYLVNIHRGRLT